MTQITPAQYRVHPAQGDLTDWSGWRGQHYRIEVFPLEGSHNLMADAGTPTCRTTTR
ncbi:hypothetical protein ACFRJ8_15460 [Arthrobacter sp. NPDC056886]|uniref:hypothetical protein n=1 Tax=Arthrobacter sp. NPDC056886 TaxID=3345960 RepID=UPI00367183F1